MITLCIQGRTRTRISGGRLYDIMEGGPTLPIAPISSGTEDTSEAPSGVCRGNSSGTLLASSAVVPDLSVNSNRSCETSAFSRSTHTGFGQNFPPRSEHDSPHCMENIPEIKEIIDKSKKTSTSLLYSYKWKSFLKLTESRGLSSSLVSLSTLLQFLRYLFDFQLSISTLKVYIAAIISFQPQDSPASCLFSHPTVKAFLKGLTHLRPPVKPPVPQWSLHLVLHSLMSPPFEPLASCDLKMLSLKVLFLVAITSARRAGELAALRADQPFLQFFHDKVVLHTDVSFLPISLKPTSHTAYFVFKTCQ